MAYTRLGPFADGGAPYLSAATFNHFEDGIAVGAAQGITVPAPTGNAATDTTNITAAITAAQAAATNLYLPPTNGVFYKMNTGITWDLTRGSIIGAGTDIDFGNLTTGAAITVTGPGTGANGGYTAHRSTINRISGLNVQGYAASGVVDGIYINDGYAIDGGTIDHVMLNGFRDGLTYGNNVWLIRHEKVGVGHFTRYAVNLTVAGTNSGENLSYQDCVFFSGSASASSVGVYSPATTNTEARFVGCSFDYNTLEGQILGGNVTFIACHFEDNATGPMFVYSCTAGGNATSVAFRDCAWDSSTVTARDHLHEIQTSTQSKVTVTFDGDKGGVYPGTYSTWLVDNSGLADFSVASTVQSFAVDSTQGSGLLLGDTYNLLTNGSFGDSSSFVATPGVGGWAIPGTGTWTIGAGGQPGAGLVLTASTAVSGTAQQRIPVPADRRPIRVAGKMFVSAYTSGSIQLGTQWFAADGTTVVGGGAQRIQSALSAVSTSWTQIFRRFTPPKGAVYLTVQLTAASFVGTAVWDQIEAVPL